MKHSCQQRHLQSASSVRHDEEKLFVESPTAFFVIGSVHEGSGHGLKEEFDSHHSSHRTDRMQQKRGEAKGIIFAAKTKRRVVEKKRLIFPQWKKKSDKCTFWFQPILPILFHFPFRFPHVLKGRINLLRGVAWGGEDPVKDGDAGEHKDKLHF